MISFGNDGKSDDGVDDVDGRLSMNVRTSLSIFCSCSVLLPSFELELESLNSNVEGIVVVGGAS